MCLFCSGTCITFDIGLTRLDYENEDFGKGKCCACGGTDLAFRKVKEK